MDQHPIPQDVTGFQFKLIGTMTVKQFGYVAAGVIMAVIVFYLPLTGLLGILAKVILIPLLGGSGAAIAFVPIEGRPVDVMAGNFFKAAFSPQQYVYRKAGKKFKFSYVDTTKAAQSTAAGVAAGVVAAPPVSVAAAKRKEVNEKEAKLQALLQSAHNENKSTLDKKEATMLKSLALPAAPQKAPAATAPAAAHPAPALAAQHPAAVAAKPVLKTLPTPAAPTPALAAPAIVKPQPAPAAPPTSAANPLQEVTLAQQEKQLQQELQTAQQEETSSHAPAAHQKVVDLQKQLEDVHAQKQKLEQELISLKNQLNSQTPAQPQMMQAGAGAPAAQPAVPAMPKPTTPLNAAPAPAPVQPQAPGMPASQYAKTIGQAAPKKADLPHVSDTPNVVVGIVKDPRGNILPNMLVEVKDKDGNPVRAFKTNALGQFASATPLATGVYTIELDDPKKQQRFDVIQITANNQIMLPIEIISHDAREDLRKQLFN